jgi:DNA-binding transcriptional MerR regulator
VRTHTIGEVLNRLKDEFDDITISKIRFLEAEGLISPDRTESGYRKFTSADIDRLRYVLRAQRDRYLPLKVIKEELARLDAGLPVGGDPAPAPPPPAGAAPSVGDGATSTDAEPPLLAPPGDGTFTTAELADATGVTEADVGALRDHGLLGDGPRYDAHDLQVVRLAAELLEAGLEARHLRMYRQFADRESALAEQLVAPLLRQRNPDSRRLATEQAERLARLGGELHRTLLARELTALLRS